MARIPFATVQQVVAEAFIKAGMNEQDANTCARIHTESSCDGIYSHGLNRVARFVDFLKRGWVDPNAKPSLVKKLGVIEIYDGNRGTGILNAFHATDRAMAIAAEQGVGIVTLRNTTHWMRGGTYGWQAADAGCVGICWTNTQPNMPAWGARDRRIGNNPFIVALPRKEGHLVCDMAMAQFSYGQMESVAMKGGRLPVPGGYDEEGNLSTDPVEIAKTWRVLPIGFWKGSSLSILLDLVATVLSGGCLLYTSPSPRDGLLSRMPSSA